MDFRDFLNDIIAQSENKEKISHEDLKSIVYLLNKLLKTFIQANMFKKNNI